MKSWITACLLLGLGACTTAPAASRSPAHPAFLKPPSIQRFAAEGVPSGERVNWQIAGLETNTEAAWAPPEQWARASWRNTGPTIYVREARVWMGFDGASGFIDGNAQLVRERDGNTLVWAPIDHYADPSQPIIISTNFTPEYVEVRTGDVLTLRLRGVRWPADPNVHVAAAAWISFVTAPPK